MHQFLWIEGRLAGEQFVEQHAERVNVGARVNVEAAHERLLRAHVGGRADELLERGKDSLVRERFAGGGFGDAEINHFGHGHAVVHGDKNVRGFQVAVDDALLVRVLDGAADLREQFEPLLCREFFLVAVLSDFDPAHQFHHEVRATGGDLRLTICGLRCGRFPLTPSLSPTGGRGCSKDG